MKVSGSFGEMSLPAAKTYREAGNDAGEKVSATVIWGAADIPVTVPDKPLSRLASKGNCRPIR